MAKKKKAERFNKKRWALAGRLWWGLAALLLGLIATFTGYGSEVVALMGTVYLGYSATLFGSLIGTVWAIVDMFIGVWLLLWIYEKLADCGI